MKFHIVFFSLFSIIACNDSQPNVISNHLVSDDKRVKDSLMAIQMAILDSAEQAAKLNIVSDISSFDVAEFKSNEPAYVLTALDRFDSWHRTAESLALSEKPNEKVVGEKALKALVSMKAKHLPTLRKYWANASDRKLWENNIEVVPSGSGNKIVTFIGGIFASNSNIKETFEAIDNTVERLEFTQVRFKWYKEDDEYTVYKIEPPK